MKIHLWESYNPKKISVDINQDFKEELSKNIKNNVYGFAKKLNITPARLYDYFIYQNSPIPLIILINLCKLHNVSIIEMEKNITMYKQMSVPNKNAIRNPKLPIRSTPYFTSIIAHLFFDGSVPRDGKGTYYNQKNKLIMKDFINKAREVFGDIQYSIKKDHRMVLKCRFPRIVGEICKQVYEISSFGTFDARVSDKLFKLSKEHKIAFILTAILDEGSIAYDGTMMFGVNNPKLCNDVRRLCSEIGLKTNKIRNKKKSNYYYFHIKSINRFFNIANKFSKKYPLISLRHKEERLKKSLEIKKQKSYHTKEFADKRKELILLELKKFECSISYLANKFLFPPRSIRRYMYAWIKDNKISRKKVGSEYIYFIRG